MDNTSPRDLTQYDTKTLATALRDRLLKEQPAVAADLSSMLVKAGIIDPNPADPH